MTKRRFQTDIVEPSEQLILDLVRLGLQGDQSSIRQLSRKILRRRNGAAPSAAFRERLGHLLVGPDSSPLRSAAATALPVEPESNLPLAFLDRAPDSAPPLLNAAATATIDLLVRERRAAHTLLAAGLEPPKTLLLYGAPGVGKSMTARYLATALDLPLLAVDLAALMSSFLGKTGQNLRQLLDHARESPCVLLLDEFDAVAKRRDDETDIGELKRLVNVLLLELERWPSAGLLVAATNHPQLLDPAVGRRFDITLDLGLPDLPTRSAILQRATDDTGLEATDSLVVACALALDGASGADLVQVASQAARRAVLDDASYEQILAELAFDGLRSAPRAMEHRAAFCAVAADELHLSHREIAKLLGISHPTVGKLARRWRNDLAPAAVAAHDDRAAAM